jgi:hypothetical protein
MADCSLIFKLSFDEIFELLLSPIYLIFHHFRRFPPASVFQLFQLHTTAWKRWFLISLNLVHFQIIFYHIPLDLSKRAEHEYAYENLHNWTNKKVVGLQSCDVSCTCARVIWSKCASENCWNYKHMC